MTIKEQYNNEYEKLSDRQRADFDSKSVSLYVECIESLMDFSKKRGLTELQFLEFEEAIRENIVIESLYANPEDAQKVFPLARARIASLVKLMLENTQDSTPIKDLYDLINQNSGTTQIKAESADILKYLRFVVKYKNINRPDPLNEQLQ